MKPLVLEGLWDEIVAQRTELRGRQVLVIVLPDVLPNPQTPLQEPRDNLTEAQHHEYTEWQALLSQLVNRAVNANLPDEAVEREAIYSENSS